MARALLSRPRVILADEPVSMVDASLLATILGALRQMTLDLRIPVVYITHDLATAYQVAENIVVLYRGTVVEAGDVEMVVKDPRHPYTRLLVGSIPVPGVERTWTANGTPARAAAPPLFRTAAHRVVACYLDREAPAVPAGAMGSAFVEPPAGPAAA